MLNLAGMNNHIAKTEDRSRHPIRWGLQPSIPYCELRPHKAPRGPIPCDRINHSLFQPILTFFSLFKAIIGLPPLPPHFRSHHVFLFLTLALLLPSPAFADSIVVFNEIMYHPATNEPALEWVELYNQNAVDIDLSEWRITGGIDFVFPNNTVIKAGGYLVVAISPDTLSTAATVTNVVGPFAGRLSNNGEELRLRDINNRLIDSVDYGVDGEWPVSPDGAGTSLAKRRPNVASKLPENWSASSQIGGTPGTVNFSTAPVLGPKTNVVPITAAWRFEDSGTDLGSSWRGAAFDDRLWATGTALFYVEEGALPAPKNTPLVPNRNTYYFRGTFVIDGNPADKIVTFRPVIDDGAVVYLNGTELTRFNMPAGAVTYATIASTAVANATYSGAFSIPSAALVSGQNVIAVEVHQGTTVTNVGLRIVPASTYSASWDGDDGDFFSPASPALAPTNAARASAGADVFTSSNPNLATNLIDGRYGNASSWAPAVGDSLPFIIVRFNQTNLISSIAWSRDNGDATEAGCAGGTCTDRTLGNYTFQYTLVTNPAIVSVNSSNPTNGWATIATVQYLSAQPGFTPHLRHRFDFSRTTGPLYATGIRIRPATTNTIDEIEINPPVGAAFDAVFGLELTAQDILPPPPKIVFNEIGGANPANFWIELINAGDSPVNLAGMELVRSGAAGPSFVFAPQSLPAGGMVAVTQDQLGFGAAEQDKLFLYTSGRLLVLDAIGVRTNSRARSPDGMGPWRYPAETTLGSSNVFAFHDEIVFNEIMYHHRPFDPVPSITSNLTALSITGSWRYNDSGIDPGSDWAAIGFDDSIWPVGNGLMVFNTGALPAATNTTLAAGRTAYYFRTRFNFNGFTTNLALNLRSIVDDGAIFYLNGLEIYRQNMPPGPVSYSTSASSPIGDASYTDQITLSASNLVQGVNVLAVEVHQITSAASSSGIVLSGGGLTLVEEGPFGGTPPMNLARQPGVAPFVIDSLAGFPIHDYLHLNDGAYGNPNSWIGNSGSPGYAGLRFGGLFTISSIAFGRDNLGAFSDRTLGTYTLQYTRVANPDGSTAVTGNADTGWATVGTLNYQSAGAGLFANPSRRHRFTFTPVDATGMRLLVPATGIGGGTCIDELEVNPPDTSGDVAFGAELVLTTTLAPAIPFAESNEEWVEFFNRSSIAVEMSEWRIDGAIDYHFPTGTIVPAGGFIVVAHDALALKAKWPEVASSIIGDFSNRMSDGDKVTLKDSFGNVVNTIHVHSREWSDGGGSSLELTDPRSDNDNPAAWLDSDESTRSNWQNVTYRMAAGQRFGNVLWNEFRIGMLDAGEVLVDDVSVVRDPEGTRQQLIQNGNFETTSGNTHWRMLGDHSGSQIIAEPGNAANHVLKVSATAPARTSHNHIESTFLNNTALVDGQEYEVSFRARWVAGSPQLGATAYFQKLARTTLLPLPFRHGTPGAVNSRFAANIGPALSGLKHTPVVPRTNETVTVSVQASDPDGIVAATLNYSVNPASAFTAVTMTQSNRTWSASIPGQNAGQIVQFYVSAQDGVGATGFAPAQGLSSRALYQVADAQGANLSAHELRLIQLDADRDFLLNSTNVMSQQRLRGTVIYDRSEVFYDVAVRLQGSAAGRARDGEQYIGYDIAFPPDHLFRGVHGSVGIDRSARAPIVRQQDEIYILHMFQRAGLPVQHVDLCYFVAPKTIHTGPAILQLGAYDGRFVDEQFGEDGSIFNFDITYEPSITVDGSLEAPKLPVPLQGHIGTDFADLGNDKEQYRSPFDIRFGERADDFSGLIRLCQTMGLPQAEFDAKIAAALNLKEASRVMALTILCGIGDIYFSSTPSLPHNCRIFMPADGQPVQFLPWDMDFVFTQGATSSIFPNTGANISKLMNNAATRRLYLGQIYDLCQVVFEPAYMTPWLAHYGAVVGQNYTGGSTYIQSRRASALGQLPAAVPFAITSNNGNDFSINTNLASLAGTGWIDIREIEVNGIPYGITWTTITNWTMSIPLVSGTNMLMIQAIDLAGNRRANLADSITITNTLPPVLLPVVINEWMADNFGPAGFADPADHAFDDWFELYNPNNSAIDLSGFHLTDELGKPGKWTIPTNTIIAGRGFLLVWADENGSQNSPTNQDLHANFKLRREGEELGLFAPDALSPQHTVAFGLQIQNVSQGLFPDGATDTRYFMTNWSPRASNRLGRPPAPQITALRVEEGLMTMTFSAIPSRTYRVEVTDDLGAGLWTPVSGFYTAANGTVTLSQNVGAAPQMFFRVWLQ